MADIRNDGIRRSWPRPTFAAKITVLLLIFLAVPVILYDQFRVANAEKNELEAYNTMMIGRELKMIELKKEVNELLKRSGEKEKYETE